MKLKLTDEQKDTLSYDDVAYLILKETNKKAKIQDLFKEVVKLLDLPESVYENNIGEFFELIVTDKRFIMLDNGYCDLKINHSSKVIIDDEDEDFDIQPEDQDDINEIEEEDNYDEDANPDDDTGKQFVSYTDTYGDKHDLVIIDDLDELDSDMM